MVLVFGVDAEEDQGVAQGVVAPAVALALGQLLVVDDHLDGADDGIGAQGEREALAEGAVDDAAHAGAEIGVADAGDAAAEGRGDRGIGAAKLGAVDAGRGVA